MLAILKACGIISMSWPVVIAGLVWVPTVLLLITLWVACLLYTSESQIVEQTKLELRGEALG